MTTDNNPPAADDYERVRPEWGCPRCGEDDIDWLIWIDDERIRCVHCGTIYHPHGPEAESRGD